MGSKIVFVSYPIRGRLYSALRYKDIKTVRSILSAIRRRNYRRMREGKDEIVPTAPYLLHAECMQDVEEARMRFAGWECNPPWELRVYGGNLSDGMRAEIARMHDCDLPVTYQLPGIEQQTFLCAAE